MFAIKIKSGDAYDIYALEDSGRCEMLDFIDSLKASNVVEFGKLMALLDATAEAGKLKNPQKFKYLADGIHEFKTYGGIRVLCFFDGQCMVVLTHGFMKKKKYESEIKRAVNMMYKYTIAKAQGALFYRKDEI